jgi:yecA family protein
MADSIDYPALGHLLQRAGAETQPAESHGILCGMLCAQYDVDRGRWMNELFASEAEPSDLLARELADALEPLREETVRQLHDENFGFELLLPDDQEPLARRAQALADWCRGFLLGFSTLGGVQAGLSGDAQEVLGDLVQISRLQGEEGVDDEQEEESLVEIIEYVRVGVLLIREELRPAPTDARRH